MVVPPNCYGGTNDQARRAEALTNVEIVDLLVDGDNDMVKSIDTVLAQIALEDAIYIIAEIPTNPRVEVPNLIDQNALTQERTTAATGTIAIDPVLY
jgi:hypothetical protein